MAAYESKRVVNLGSSEPDGLLAGSAGRHNIGLVGVLSDSISEAHYEPDSSLALGFHAGDEGRDPLLLVVVATDAP